MNNIKKKLTKHGLNSIILYKFLVESLPVDEASLDLQLINDYSDIEELMKLNDKDKFKYIYIEREKIEQILYEADEILVICDEDNICFMEFENLFLLDLLLLKNPDILNYSFSKKLIREIVKTSELVKNPIVLTLFEKIILDMINYYRSGAYDEAKEKKELDDIEKECKKIINENLNKFEEFGIKGEEFNSMKIDEIYSKILISIIEENKFENADNISKKLKELNFDKIFLTKTIYNNLIKKLNYDGIYMKPYRIMKVADLFNIKIVNFYNLLLKYIFKNNLYIYNVEFLLIARRTILHMIREMQELNKIYFYKSKYETDKNLISGVDSLVKTITDNEYYFVKYNEFFKLSKLEVILFFHKFFFFEKKTSELEKVIENKVSIKYDELLEKYNYIFEKIPIILNIINDINRTNFIFGDLFLNKNALDKVIKSWKLIIKTIREKKGKKLRKDIKKNLYELFQKNNTSDFLKKFFNEEQIDFFLKENEHLSLSFKKNQVNQVNENKDKSQLIAKAKETVNVYFDYKSENSSSIIIQSYSLGENSKSNLSGNESKSNTNNTFNKKKEYNNWIDSKSDKFKKSNKYKILEHYEVIGKHKSAEFSRELSNGEFLSGGNDNYLYWYDITFALKKKIIVENNQHNLYEIKSRDNNNKDEINIISFSEKKINYIRLKPAYNESHIDGKIKNSSVMSVYYLDYKSSLILGQNKLGKFNNQWNSFDSTMATIKNEVNIYFRGGILLRNEFEKYFILTSTEIIPKGENIMILYNYTMKKSTTIVEGYSFYPSYNNVCEISQLIQIEKKLILAVCQKKENDGQYKNGILAVNLKINGKIRFSTDFYPTNNFEPYCFCQILKVENNNSIYEDISNVNNIIIKETEYVLIGGFDRDKRQGCIKLYKIGINDEHLIIKYIQDIYIEQGKNFKGFNGQISSIVQSRTTGNIIITCWDGNVHLFKPPNLEILG